MLSINLLGNRDGRVVFDDWRARARTGLRQLPGWMPKLLSSVAPGQGDFPDFLTPIEGLQGFEAGLDAVLSTPRTRLRRELLVLGRAPTADLMQGEALRALGVALRSYHEIALKPYWPRSLTQVQLDQTVRARAFMQGGMDAVLNSFRPLLRWTPPVLEADYPEDRDVHLRGRGLILVPSLFCWGKPVTLIDPELSPVLVYPVDRTASWWARPDPSIAGKDQLAALLGATRAAVLRTAADGYSAGELVRRVASSPGAVSHHLRVLREAGLIKGKRHGTTILYTVTPLGWELLNENPTQ